MDVPDGKLFDTESFIAAIEANRAQKGMSWREVAREVELSPSTLTRLRQGSVPDIETFARLCSWANVAPEGFIRSAGDKEGDADGPLVGITALLRSDPALNVDDVEVMEAMIQATYERFRSRSD